MRTLLVVLSSTIFGIILTACALLTPILDSTTPVNREDATRVACAAFRTITWAKGDDAAALGILAEIHAGRRPADTGTLTFLREMIGDTNGTIAEIKPHNAAYRALCPTVPIDNTKVTVKTWEPGKTPLVGARHDVRAIRIPRVPR